MSYSENLVEKGKNFFQSIIPALNIAEIEKDKLSPTVKRDIEKVFGQDPAANLEVIKFVGDFEKENFSQSQAIDDIFKNTDVKEGDFEKLMKEIDSATQKNQEIL